MAVINSFRDLKVYKKAGAAARKVFILTKDFPKSEQYSLVDQIRRSSRAVNAMFAEAWARRRYEAAFVNGMNLALGEAMETQAWLDHALSSGYITKEAYLKHDQDWQEVGAMLNSIISKSSSFCPPANK